MQRREPAEREVRHKGDAAAGEIVDQSVVGPVCQIVLVLHADDLADLASLRDLQGRDVAEAEVADQALLLTFSQDRELRLIEPSAGP